MKEKRKNTVFITGGAKRIGATITTSLAELGYNIIIHYNNSKSEAKKLCSKINKKKEIAFAVKADLKDENQIKNAFESGKKKFGHINSLINNASIFEYDNLKSVSSQGWNNHLLTNLTAPMILSKLLYKNLPKNIKGDIINIIDQRVLNLTPHFLSYTISKSGLWTLTKTLALELSPKIKVNAIGPGPVIKSKFQTNKEFYRQCKNMPLKTGSTPNEIAKTVEYILCMKSMTGQLITLDGGQHLGWGQVNNNKVKD